MREVAIVLDKEDLQNLLEENTPIYLVTDEGVKDNIGYYSWVIATVIKIVFKAKGHAPGPLKQMESLRAESIGLLSILCFIAYYVNSHKIQVKDKQWIHYCNNMSKVRRIKWMNIRTVLTPSASIRADMDVHTKQVQV
eukprot:15021149-Ditylum_brightwellii.AAC.1